MADSRVRVAEDQACQAPGDEGDATAACQTAGGEDEGYLRGHDGVRHHKNGPAMQSCATGVGKPSVLQKPVAGLPLN